MKKLSLAVCVLFWGNYGCGMQPASIILHKEEPIEKVEEEEDPAEKEARIIAEVIQTSFFKDYTKRQKDRLNSILHKMHVWLEKISKTSQLGESTVDTQRVFAVFKDVVDDYNASKDSNRSKEPLWGSLEKSMRLVSDDFQKAKSVLRALGQQEPKKESVEQLKKIMFGAFTKEYDESLQKLLFIKVLLELEYADLQKDFPLGVTTLADRKKWIEDEKKLKTAQYLYDIACDIVTFFSRADLVANKSLFDPREVFVDIDAKLLNEKVQERINRLDDLLAVLEPFSDNPPKATGFFDFFIDQPQYSKTISWLKDMGLKTESFNVYGGKDLKRFYYIVRERRLFLKNEGDFTIPYDLINYIAGQYGYGEVVATGSNVYDKFDLLANVSGFNGYIFNQIVQKQPWYNFQQEKIKKALHLPPHGSNKLEIETRPSPATKLFDKKKYDERVKKIDTLQKNIEKKTNQIVDIKKQLETQKISYSKRQELGDLWKIYRQERNDMVSQKDSLIDENEKILSTDVLVEKVFISSSAGMQEVFEYLNQHSSVYGEIRLPIRYGMSIVQRITAVQTCVDDVVKDLQSLLDAKEMKESQALALKNKVDFYCDVIYATSHQNISLSMLGKDYDFLDQVKTSIKGFVENQALSENRLRVLLRQKMGEMDRQLLTHFSQNLQQLARAM
ncbi:MAG: hypothetical protein UU47_C0001G0009 [candidate division TM6 bacterium GW2011_GWE2_41_16]|nr:MAG: hypothetical protein UU47_C0001G0009 [candidate division TM6 bacterium GW2011_GWE2_41_16]